MTPREFELRVNAGRYSTRRTGERYTMDRYSAEEEAHFRDVEECNQRLHTDLEALGGVSELPESVRTKLRDIAYKVTPSSPTGMRAFFHHLGSNYKDLAILTLMAYDAGRCKGVREDQ